MDAIEQRLARIEAKLDTLLGKKRPNTKGISKPPEKPLKFPPLLNTSEFKATWMEWVKHRNEKKKRLTPTTVERQLKLLERVAQQDGVSEAIQVIERSILNGWMGLFERHEKGEEENAYDYLKS